MDLGPVGPMHKRRILEALARFGSPVPWVSYLIMIFAGGSSPYWRRIVRSLLVTASASLNAIRSEPALEWALFIMATPVSLLLRC